MAEAGLTHGGFYAHFESKEALVREAIEAGFDGSRLKTESGLEALVKSYLRPSHRDHPGQGCVIAPLVAEIARHPEETRAAFTARLERFLDRIAAQLPAGVPEGERAAMASGVLAVMLGSLQMARAVTDAELSDAMLDAGIKAALKLAEV
jgi:AcrR family transcriptional regulator